MDVRVIVRRTRVWMRWLNNVSFGRICARLKVLHIEIHRCDPAARTFHYWRKTSWTN